MLFTVDEVDPTLDEMVQLAAFYQHFVRGGAQGSAPHGGTAAQHLIFAQQQDRVVSPALEPQGA